MKIALVQMDVALGRVDQNLATMLSRLEESRAQGAELTLFPECALTGYCFDSLAEALPLGQTIPGPATEQFQAALTRLGGYAVFGLLERVGDGLCNVAVLVGSEGVLAAYRKIHLPGLGIDRFVTYGDRPFGVQPAGDVRVGLGICYDSAFPESMRVMTLGGAELIALPTNFPTGAEGMVSHVIRTRAMENHVYFACCNRVGEERGFRFIGQSQIVDPSGNWLARSEGTAEEILYADIDPALARDKRIVRVPGKHAIHRLADRRPEMYGPIVEPHSIPRPGRE